MKIYLALVIPVLLLAAPADDEKPDVHEIAKRASRNYQKNELASLRYEYIEDDEVKGKAGERFRVTPLYGTPYERLIAKNGQPLSGDAEAREQQKFEKAQFARKNEIKSIRDNRIRKWKDETWFLEEAPDAYDFQLLPEEELNGRPAYVLDCVPKAGFVPREERSKMFVKIHAKAWVDKKDLQIVKIEAEALDAVSIPQVAARLGKGTHLGLEQMRLEDGTWVLKKLRIEGRGSVLRVDKRQLDETVTYSEYRFVPLAKTGK